MNREGEERGKRRGVASRSVSLIIYERFVSEAKDLLQEVFLPQEERKVKLFNLKAPSAKELAREGR